MAWQRVGCSYDGGSNVLGQAPIDYASVSPRGQGQARLDDNPITPRAAGGQQNAYYGQANRTAANGNNPPQQDNRPPISSGPRQGVEQSIEKILLTMTARMRPGGTLGLKGLSRKFRLFDDGAGTDERDQMLSYNEFSTGIQDQQGFRPKQDQLNEAEIRDVFEYCDLDGSGNLNVDEFIFRLVKTVLPDQCYDNVEKVFRAMDRDGSGKITIDEMKVHYNMKMNPKVQNGIQTEQQAFAEYIASFEPDFLDGKENVKDSVITKQEWMDYYCGVYARYKEQYGPKQAPCVFNTFLYQTYKNFGKATQDLQPEQGFKGRTFQEYRAEQKGQGDAARKAAAGK